MNLAQRLVLGLLLVGAGVGAAAPGQACIPSLDFVQDWIWTADAPASVCVWPDGRPAVAYLFGGTSIAADLSLRLVDFGGDPIPGVALSDAAWFADSGPGVLCPDPPADPISGPDGWLDVPFAGGGHRGPDTAGPFVLILNACPQLLLELPEPVYFNSPDLNGDLKVDLADVPLFAADFFAGTGAYRSDFVWDGTVNLADLVVFADAVGAGCP